jgi:AraC-like DNA-binding protein
MANVVVLFIQVFLYLFLILRELRIHKKRVADIFSNPEKFQLNWLFFFNISLALSAFVCVFLYAANPARLFGDDRYLAYPMLLIALILWFLGIMGNNQSSMVIPLEKEDINFDEGFTPELVTRLLMYFEDKKPYLNSELKIWDITSELGSNRTYISKAINNSFGQNFSSFVNSYRIKEAKRMIETDPSKPLKIIADEVGFGSISSLSRSFYQQYSIKISEYRNSRFK